MHPWPLELDVLFAAFEEAAYTSGRAAPKAGEGGPAALCPSPRQAPIGLPTNLIQTCL